MSESENKDTSKPTKLSESLKDLIQDDLVRHEGCIRRIYLDSEGLPTFGIGHLVTKEDPEYHWPVGTPVEFTRVWSCFLEDFESAVKDAESLIPDLYQHPEPVQRVMVNMAFNLGRIRLGKFKKLLRALKARDYIVAAEEMEDSRWYHQVGRRSKELVRIMESAGADVGDIDLDE